jgi:HlyD family secretion protein
MKRFLARILGGIMIALLTGCSLPVPPGAATVAEPDVTTTPPPPNQIIADAVVIPERYVDLSFPMGGTVGEILVRENDRVQEGMPLARLDTRELELRVAQAQASLAQAQASYEQRATGATDQQIAAQRALARVAQAQLERAKSGNITPADIASAQAQLRAAQARLDALKNPAPAVLSAAQLSVTQAGQGLAATRASASAAKTNAELAMQQAADSVTKAQASYATAKVNWEYVRDTGNDPTNPTSTNPATGEKTDNMLNDVQERQYYEAFVQAEASVRSAEKALAQAQVSYDTARQDEAIQVQQAEAALANAEQQLAALKRPSANDLTQAQASVDQARAALQKIQQGGTAADIAAAQASVAQAQANLEQLTIPPRPVDLAEAQARVDAAQVSLQQAEHELAQATLLAPFAGTIAEHQIEVGQQVSAGAAPSFVLADLGRWKIETDNLSERDVVRLQVGSPAQIRFEALPELTLAGAVAAIRLRGVDRYGDMTYTVTITPNSWDERLRWNMSASVAIEPTKP